MRQAYSAPSPRLLPHSFAPLRRLLDADLAPVSESALRAEGVTGIRPPEVQSQMEPLCSERGSARRSRHQPLGGPLHEGQVILALEGLRVDLHDVLGAARAGRDPGVLGLDLEPCLLYTSRCV